MSKIGDVNTTERESLDLELLRKRAPLELIAARVKRARKVSGLSHDAICDRMNISRAEDEKTVRQTLIRWEQALRRPALDLLTLYAEATGRHVEWFLDPDLDPSPFQDAEAA